MPTHHESETFAYDVFLSHSSKDKAIVRPLAERLKKDGLRVWFDEWEVKPGDSIPSKIEDGLERSRVLVLCMSANAFGSNWSQLESGTFRFRDPLNKDRRFLPLRLDEAPIKGSLAQFLYINWRLPDPEQEYAKLLEACRQTRMELTPEQQAARERFLSKIVSFGHTDWIRSVAFSPDGRRALSASDDSTVRLWEVDSGKCLGVFEGHSDYVFSVAWSPDGRRALSASDDSTVRLWEVDTGKCLGVFEGHSGGVGSVAWSPDGRRALSASDDNTVRLWEVDTGKCLGVFEGHSGGVWSVAWSPDGRRALSASDDSTVRLWKVDTGKCLEVFKGHTDEVRSVAWSPDGRRALSGADDNTVRLWEVDTGKCLGVFEGHSGEIRSVAWSPDGRRALSCSDDFSMRLWEVDSGMCMGVIEGRSGYVLSAAWSPDGRRALSGTGDNTVRLWAVDTGKCLGVFEGHSSEVRSVAWSPDGRRALSCSDDRSMRLWEIDSEKCLRVFEGHSGYVLSVAWSPDGCRALSGANDNTVRLWEVDSGKCLGVFEGHSDYVFSVAWSPDGRRALSGAGDGIVRLWEVDSGECLGFFEGHSDEVRSVAWSPDGRRAISGSDDNTVRLWEVDTGKCLGVFEGHSGGVRSVAWSPDGRRALSGSGDRTVRLWEVDTGKCLGVFEGHSGYVLSVAWSPDGRRALSASDDNTVRLWEVDTGKCLGVFEGHSGGVGSVAWSPDGRRALSGASNGVTRIWEVANASIGATLLAGEKDGAFRIETQIEYTNAKVLLVGETSAGKTGLSKRLALGEWEPSDSTVGAWATHWKLPVSSMDGVEREIWLWDFGGQADQRLIHQLYMDETALAVLVFDGQKEDLFETLGQWDRDLARASQKQFAKLLVAGRIDAGGLRTSRTQIESFKKERGYLDFLETSAKTGLRCEELKQAILKGIRWEDIPWRSSPLLFKRLKDEIIRLKDAGRVLMRFNELREALQLRLSGELTPFTNDELKAVVSLLAGPGVVWELKFGSWVLLQPERINAYAQAVIQTMREDEYERGCLAEERVLGGDLTYHRPEQRITIEEERFVLLAMHKILVERGLCLREHTETGTMLIFPSYYRRERPELVGHPAALVSYRFNGFLDEIYATLVVRLHHTKPFTQDQLWRYAADFKTLTGKQLGVKLERRSEGAGELVVYADPTITDAEKIIFSRYVHEHILQKGRDMARLRHYVCPHCGTPVGNREVAMERLTAWLANQPTEAGLAGKIKALATTPEEPTILCAKCEKRVPLWDDLEQYFASDEVKERVRQLQAESDLVLDSESKDRALVGDVISTVALADQIIEEYSAKRYGLDMEIEFKDDDGKPTGKRLYLQLKSGDSHLRKRKGDDVEIFQIHHEDHAVYWMNQAFPVFLVIADSKGEVRWMEIRDYLKRESDNGKKPVKQIVFDGERFDVMSVRRWRDKVLSQQSPPKQVKP